tara:strand:+ start:802 stop:1902 length:1101 start_codon:yes stop_codon:yes gene_type:complete
MGKYCSLVLMGLFLCIQPLVAQEEFKFGEIITSTNDTIEGLILYQTDQELVSGFEFKSNASSVVQNFGPENVKSFNFDNGRYFESITIKLPNGEEKTKFFKRVLEGKIDLYLHRIDGQSKPNFYLVNNSTNKNSYLIYPKSEEYEHEYSTYNFSNKRYLGQLKVLKESKSPSFEEKLKFKEKDILANLEKYNQQYQDSFVNKKYEEPIEISYDLSVGFTNTAGDYALRFALYRNKQQIDKTRKLFITRGITYNAWADQERNYSTEGTGTANYFRHVLSILPYGIKYQTNSGTFRPYFYGAPGVAIFMDKAYTYSNGEDTGIDTNIYPVPVINFGAGVKIKVKDSFFFTEVTPAIDHGLFLNVGYSF